MALPPLIEKYGKEMIKNLEINIVLKFLNLKNMLERILMDQIKTFEDYQSFNIFQLVNNQILKVESDDDGYMYPF